MKIVYLSSTYSADNVTGRYVRCDGRKDKYVFRVFETETDKKGRKGFGPTIRVYDCDGSGLPADLRERCIKSKMTERWE